MLWTSRQDDDDKFSKDPFKRDLIQSNKRWMNQEDLSQEEKNNNATLKIPSLKNAVLSYWWQSQKFHCVREAGKAI